MRTILRLLVSLKTAVVTICILTLLAMLGTFIPQSLEANQYLEKYRDTGHLILALGFDDMYRSALFQFCLWFLSISTLVCILTRWKSTSRKLFHRHEQAKIKEIKAYKTGKPLENFDKEKLNYFCDSIREHKNGTITGLKISGKMSLLGGMFIHIGFLLILIGGLIGVFWGVETVLRGRKGDKIPIPDIEAVRAARDADKLSRKARNIRHFSPEAPVLNDYRQKIEALHEIYHQSLASPSFKIRVNDLWVEHHLDAQGNPGSVKSWNSNLSFIEDKQVIASGVTKVNAPLYYRGYNFYQASWNKFFKRIAVKVDLTQAVEDFPDIVDASAKFPVVIELETGKPATFSWTGLTLVLHDFMPDFRIIDGRFISVSHELNNPAARIVAYDEEGKVAGRAWAFPDDRIMSANHVSNLPFLFTFIGASPEYETGLQMTYDPGKPIVWAGCLIFTIGLVMSFYISYKEEWILVEPRNTAYIAISGNRPAEMLKKSLEEFEQKLTKTQEKPIHE
jgi:cytochrome c biogenesis protein